MDRLTDAELARMRAEHVPTADTGECNECLNGAFPCDAALLLAELDRRKANPPEWQGRRHRSPDFFTFRCVYCERTNPARGFFPIGSISLNVLGVPKVGQVCNECHDRLETDGTAFMAELASVQAGLLGPVTNEELADAN